MSSIYDVLLIRDVFSPDDCSMILNTYGSELYEPGLIQDNRSDYSLRKSSIQFVQPDDDSNWIFEKLLVIVQTCNTNVFEFDLNTFEEGFQFTKYDVGDHFTWHVDLGQEER